MTDGFAHRIDHAARHSQRRIVGNGDDSEHHA